MRKGRRGVSLNVVPAKAGSHPSGDGAADKWVPAFAGTTILVDREQRVAFAYFAAKLCFFFLLLLTSTPAFAACIGAVAGDGTRLWRAAAADGASSVTYLGHSSFLIESPQGVRIVTDYNGIHRAAVTPDIVTMNNAHTTHYTDAVEPGVKFVLRGWDPGGRIASHQLDYRDVRVHNVPTNIRDFGATRYNGNSIFVFDVAGLCIAHLGHLHHTLTQAHLTELGSIDIVMVPVDGSFTLNQHDMVAALQQLKPKIVLPMHVFSEATLDRFLARAADSFRVRRLPEPIIRVSRADLPSEPELIVLPGR